MANRLRILDFGFWILKLTEEEWRGGIEILQIEMQKAQYNG
jgi:hypothetical protein